MEKINTIHRNTDLLFKNIYSQFLNACTHVCCILFKDFDDWDDVGLNISKPPGLLYLFREYSNYAMSDQEQLNRILDLVGVATSSRGVGLSIFATLNILGGCGW